MYLDCSSREIWSHFLRCPPHRSIWNYATDTVRVRVVPISPITLHDYVASKCHPEFILAPKPWAAFRNSFTTFPCSLMTLCPMNFSPMYLLYFLRIFSTYLSTKHQMTKSIIPIPIYLFSTLMIKPISFKQFADAGFV